MQPTNTKQRIVAVVLAGGLLLAGAQRAAAQFQQYTPPGQFEETRETMAELLDRAMKESRWRLGRFFFDPWFGVRDVAYIDNVQGIAGGEIQSDLTATVGAGLRAYRPIGETVFAAHVLPEYVWWLDLSERRRLNGRYGAGLFGNFGRTGLEITATRTEDSIFFSRELEVPVNTRYDVGAADLEIAIGGGVSLFAGGELRRIEYLDQDDPLLADLDLLDRDEEILRAGIRFAISDSFSLGVGVEESSVDFEMANRDRSNTGTSPALQLEYDGSGFYLSAELAARNLEPEPGSAFVAYDEITGRIRIETRMGARIRPHLFANRNLAYSLTQRWAYLEDTGAGVGVRASLGRLASLRLFVEQGTNDYFLLGTGVVDRQDDLTAIGADLRFSIGRATLTLAATRTEYESNLPGFDREVTVIRTQLGFGSSGSSPWG